ncbi:fibroin heavy chain-like [Schistocerca americana]|uniref:fibroin heavy chain-like n=1 Tax=Schistocerca americana TaxID=7009 RepID=UPI001F4F2A1B|nr:fibroin heavy chain-like [Schistocerca americana]
MTAALVTLVPALALMALAAASPGYRHVPGIPAGRRAEYYLQKAAGGYLFGYDTGDAAAHSHAVEADAGNELRGRYQYTDAASGRRLGISYTAGRRGFRPTSVDLATGSAVSGSAAGGAAVATPRLDTAGPGDAAHVDADYDANADASYSFSIDTDSYKRTEAADRRGNVRGRYSYSSPRGGSHGLGYVAGEGTGFVVTSGAAKSDEAESGSPAASGVVGSSAGTGGYSFSYSADDHSRQEAADAANKVRGSYTFRAKGEAATRRIDYEAGAETGFVARGSHLPVAPTLATIAGYPVPLVPAAPAVPVVAYSAPVAPAPYSGPPADVKSAVHPDGSYSFSFSTDEQSRQETADAENNVRGSYSFRSKDDGVTRKVEYSAGAATGFVASGDHLPVAPPLPSAAAPAVVSSYSSTGAEAADVAEAEAPGDASYEFSYDAGTHSRQESSDAAGNVRGRFSFVATDGVSRHVDYEAGAEKGFIAKGAHLPVPPSVGDAATTYCASCSPAAPSGYSFSYSTDDQSRDEQGDAAGNVRGSYSFTAKDDGKARHVDYSAGAATGFLARGAHLPSVASVSPASSPGSEAHSAHGGGATASDGSYSFSYSTGDHSRQESADAGNNVRGSYSFVAKDDSKSRTVEYEAGATTGFVARGSHLPGSGAAAGPLAYSGAAEEAAAQAAAPYSSQSGAGAGGYSFSYSTPDQSREETADAHNNVRGRFSFVAKDDGQRRSVEYEAGAGKGFVAKGAHLPQPLAPVPGAGLPVETAPEAADARASASGGDAAEAGGDASYSYSYETDSSSKTESADARGNVRGSYSYRTPGGAKRTFRYKSHGAEGFVVTGVEDSGAADVTAAAATAHAPAGAAATVQPQTPAAAALAQSPVSRIVAGVGSGPRLVVRKYLPPENSHKFGYIIDTQKRR